jgi:hypothetical protein
MHSGKFVFAQVLEFVSQYEFNKCVKRYNGNYHVHELNCWHLFVCCMLLAQLRARYLHWIQQPCDTMSLSKISILTKQPAIENKKGIFNPRYPDTDTLD